MLGTTVAGRYEIEAQIGVGGMGIVYRAHDTRLRRDVALKMIAPHLMQMESARVRFLREAQALAGLMHPNIVTIFDMAEDADANTVFLVMELLSGHSLRQFLQDGTCPRTPHCPRFSQIALPLCRALEAAHKRGVLHRDIKPENIFICDDGTLKLMDFGLARLLGDMSKNQSSTVAGTLAYMAPEQLRGDKLDARADVYALGVVFFEFVTGAQPFTGDNPGTVLLKHLTEPPPSLRDRLSVPADAATQEALNALDGLLTRMMAKETGERPQSAEEVRNALEQTPSQGDTLAVRIDRLLAGGEGVGGIAASALTQVVPFAPVIAPTADLAALLTARQTAEASQTAEISPSLVQQTAVTGMNTADFSAATAAQAAQPTVLVKDSQAQSDKPTSANPALVWKRRGAAVAGIGALGAVSALAMGHWRPSAVAVTKPSVSSPVPVKQRDTAVGNSIASASTPSATKPEGSTPQGKASASANVMSTPSGKSVAAPPKQGSSESVKSTAGTTAKTGEQAKVKEHAVDAEREAWRKQQQQEMALIKTLQRELEAARALKSMPSASGKANSPANSLTGSGVKTTDDAKTTAAAKSGTGAKSSAKPVKLPALPSVAEESKPPLVIGMKVARINRNDASAIHISLQNDVDCYAYFYLLPPRQRNATRLFAGYEYFAAAPKTAYSIPLLLPKTLANSRGAVLIVASKKELKNLPPTFELPPPQPLAIAPDLTGEQRQQVVRQNIHLFSDQVAQQLASNRALIGGQLMQPHDVVIRLIGSNPIVFGRNPDGSRRGPGQPPRRGRRNPPPPAEFGDVGATH